MMIILQNLINILASYTERKEVEEKEKEKIIYDVEKLKQKNKLVRNMLNILGFDELFETKYINREKFVENYNKVLKDSEFFKNKTFGLSLFGMSKKLNIVSCKGFLGFINRILKNYFLSIGIKKECQGNGKNKITIYSYFLSVYHDANEFINFKINKGLNLHNKRKIIMTNDTSQWKYLYDETDGYLSD